MNIDLLNYLDEGVIIFDKHDSIQWCNKSILTKLGYEKWVLCDKSIQEVLIEKVGTIYNKCEESIENTIAMHLYDSKGKVIKAEGKIFGDEWKGKGCYCLIIKEAEGESVSTKELKAILEHMPYAIWVADEKDNYKYTNANTLTMVNQLTSLKRLSSREELLKQHPEEVYKYSLNKNIFKDDQKVLRKGIMINEERSSKGDKECLDYQIIKIPMFNKEHIYQGYIGMSQYNILKQEVDIAKVIDGTNPELRIDEKVLYDQLIQSLEFSTSAARVFQGNNIIILKYNRDVDQIEEVGRLKKSENKVLASNRLKMKGSELLRLVEENTEWALEAFEKRMACDIKEVSQEGGKHYIRLNPIEYNGEFVGVIFTTYASKLHHPLMDSCIIDKLCQHIAIIFKSMEYSVELRKQLLITEEIEAERSSYKEALEIETLKTEFLENMSHELKTPLSIMYSTLQMFELELREQQVNIEGSNSFKQLLRYKNVEKQNIFRLMRLVNNITDISKMGSGYYKAKWVNCNIVQIIEEITLSVAEYVKNKKLSIVFDTQMEELIMACDPEKIERIMLNLLSNAVKYTNTGDVIEVDLNKEEEQLVILVKDTGIGIPKDKQTMIFNRFAQVDTSFKRRCEGSGIGLALVKSLVELQQGNISVESEEGKGSCFKVVLPISRVDQQIQYMDMEKSEELIHKCGIEFSDIYDI